MKTRVFARFLSVLGMTLLAAAVWMGVSGVWRERHDRALLGEAIAAGKAPSSDIPDVLAILRVDRLGWSVTVRRTAHVEDLARGAGWISGTAAPGQAGNIGIAGHRDTFFRPLAQVRIDDEIALIAPNAETRYRVTETLIVDPAQLSVLNATSTPTLTLVTCYPFRFVGPAPNRFVVKAQAIAR
jgi:sortase A